MYVLIDCNALCYSSFFTLGDLADEDRKVGIIYGFLRKIFSMSRDWDNARWVFCWDSKKSYRKRIYPQYKEKDTRKQAKEDLTEEDWEQFDILRGKVLPAMGFCNVYRVPGYEADDLLHVFADMLQPDWVMVTGDNDMFQSLQYGGKIFNPTTKKIITADIFKEKFGIHPDQWAMAKAIGGCRGDNVEGIQGVGDPKSPSSKALKILNGTLESGKVVERYWSEEGTKIIERNLRLVELPFNGPKPLVTSIPEELPDDELTKDRIVEVLDHYRFDSLLDRGKIALWEKRFVNN